jgi:hypothetical protein
MPRSDDYRARAEECRTRAETSFNPQAWLKLASNWLTLIPQPRQAASEESEAMEPEAPHGTEAVRHPRTIGGQPQLLGGGRAEQLKNCLAIRVKQTSNIAERSSMRSPAPLELLFEFFY